MSDFIRSVKRLLSKINGKSRYVFLLSIIILCAISLCVGIYYQYYTVHQSNNFLTSISKKGREKSQEEYANLISQFNNIFTNEFKTDNSFAVKKTTSGKEIIYTGYNIVNEDESYYHVNAQIPTINIDNSYIAEINQNIRTEFYDKANSIMRQSKEYIVYTVSYSGYMNKNILSLIIKASLKEGSSIERVIIKTYNIDLENNENITFENLIARNNIEKGSAQKKIKTQIKSAYNNAKALAEEFEGIYQRDIKSKIYNIENVENYFITEKGDIYIVYSYGNNEETNEIDLIIF